MLAKRMHHRPDHGQARKASRAEIEALRDSPELRRIFAGEPKTTAHRPALLPSRRPSGTQPGGELLEARIVNLRPRRRRRRIVFGLVPVFLAGVIAIVELAGQHGTSAGGSQGADEAAAPARPDDGAIRLMAATADESASRSVGAARSPEGAHASPLGPDAVAAAPGLVLPPLKEAVDVVKASDVADQLPVTPAISTVDANATSRDAEEALVSPSPDTDAKAPLAPADPAAAAAAEKALRLSSRDRREVQQRLQLADFDPRLADGIFGADTRAAVAAWQSAMGLPATGFMDEPSMAMLIEQTDQDYRAWQAAERARRDEVRSTVVTSSVPAARPMPAAPVSEGCRRTEQGKIAFGQNMDCDAQGVRENFKKDLRNLRRDLGRLFR